MWAKRALAALLFLIPAVAVADMRGNNPPGVRLTNTLQSGSTFYVSSGTVVTLNVLQRLDLSSASVVQIGTATMTSGNPRLNICGANPTDAVGQCGYLESHYYSASGNNVVLGVLDAPGVLTNMRLQVDANDGSHIGVNIGGTSSSGWTFTREQVLDSDYDAVFNIRGNSGMTGGDTTEKFQLWMNNQGGSIKSLKGGIYLRPFTGQLYVQASSVTVSGGDVIISSTGYGIQFADGSRQTTASAGGSSTFTWPLSPRDPKLPGTLPCGVSNSTTALTSALLCDAATNENVTYSRVLKPYAGGNISIDIVYSMVSATSGNVVFVSSVACITPGTDSQDVDTKAFGTGASATSAVPGTAGYAKTATITGLNDSCAAGDLLMIWIERQGANGSDNATGDVEVRDLYVYE